MHIFPMGYISQKIFPTLEIGDFSPVCIMGVLNLSPESFYKALYSPSEQLVQKVQEFAQNGARIIDLGGRSTAPNVESISVEEEQTRVLDALQALQGNLPENLILSIDTQYSDVAESALNFAEENQIQMLINDISSLSYRPQFDGSYRKAQMSCNYYGKQ